MANRAEFKQASHTASRLERHGEYAEAAQYWQAAYFAARSKANEHWCETRREICLNAAACLDGEAID